MRQNPADVIDWTKRCTVELIQSVIGEVNKGRIFAYLTRWRDPEELYTRVLYAMFVAPADHLPHIFAHYCPVVEFSYRRNCLYPGGLSGSSTFFDLKCKRRFWLLPA
jgi:hypothetical protein